MHRWGTKSTAKYEEERDKAIEEYLAKGGTIKIIQPGSTCHYDMVPKPENDPKSEFYLPPMTPQEKWLYKQGRKRGLSREESLREVLH